MADKMMRIAGRDSSGVARAIAVDSSGNLITKEKVEQVIVQKSANDLPKIEGLYVDSNTAVIVPSNPIYSAPSESLKIELSYRPIVLPDSIQVLLALYEATQGRRSFKIDYYWDDSLIRLFVSEDGNNFSRFDAKVEFDIHNTCEITIEWSFGQLPTLNWNGETYEMKLKYGQMVNSLHPVDIPLYIGREASGRQCKGLFSNVKITGDGNLLGLWSLDEMEGSVALDSSGNNNNGSITNPDWRTISLGTIEPGESLSILDTSLKTTLDQLVWGCSGDSGFHNLEMSIELDGKKNLLLGEGTLLPHTSENIGANPNTDWMITQYDSIRGVYKFKLRETLEAPNGIKIKIVNLSSTEIIEVWALFVRGRIYE